MSGGMELREKVARLYDNRPFERRDKSQSYTPAADAWRIDAALKFADLVLALPELAAVPALREAAKNAVDCWGVGGQLTPMLQFMDELRAALALTEGRER